MNEARFRMSQTKMNIKKLVNIAKEILSEDIISNIDEIPLSRTDLNNIWNKISQEYYGNIEFKNSLNIKSWWVRNTNNFRTILKNILQNKEQTIKKKYSIDIDHKEWIYLQGQISSSGRERFKVGMSHFLSKKLQERGVKCYLTCKYNWFKEKKSQKTESPYWKGLYVCTEKGVQTHLMQTLRTKLSYL